MLSKKYQPREIEAKWQRFWANEKIYKFNLEGSEPIFSIDTPPPTVSGAMHIGHIYSYTHPEIIARFWRMRGYRVFYPFGFDDNGLPTEKLVEREFGLKATELERKDFVQLCLETTEKYEETFKKLWQSLGFSVDWELAYSTISKKVQKISQLSFLELFTQGKIYQSKSPTLWCNQCQTSIAQAETEVKEVETKFNYLTFNTSTSEKLTIATTRPELLAACVAILVHPDDQRYQHLIDKKATIPLFGDQIPIISDGDVDMAKGSGVVMCCTFGDQQDVLWWKRHNLPLKEIFNDQGQLKAGTKYAHMTVLEARQAILADLKSSGELVKEEILSHQVAHHERCGHPIEFRNSQQWFIKILAEKERFLQAAEEINWYPSYMKFRYLEWVRNLAWDWCISRQRYFGVPFPVWYCATCGTPQLADPCQLPVNPLTDRPLTPCKCGSNDFIPDNDVMDTWATSSVTPEINAGWNGGQEFRYPLLPMSLRVQAHEIIRTWTFYTIVKSLYHFNQIPWENIMISGYVMASKGEKISKSKGNAQYTPEELIAKYSADVVRLWTSQAKLGTDIYFLESEIENQQRLPIKLWNASRFVLSHLEDYTPSQEADFELMDLWILDQLEKTHQKVTQELEGYEISQALTILERFFWHDFCDNYLEIVKERLYKPEIRGERQRLSGQQTLYLVLLNILKMYAIFIPHMTEEIYQSYYRAQEEVKSIHLLPWDHETKMSLPDEMVTSASDFIDIASQVRRYKSEERLSLKTELQKLIVFCSQSSLEFIKKSEADLKAVTRAKELELVLSEDNSLQLKIEYQVEDNPSL